MTDANQPESNTRRKVLTLASMVGGAIGAAGAATPFVASFAPSRKAKGEGAPVTVNISSLIAGDLQVVAWRRKPVWIMSRTPEMISSLEGIDAELQDPVSDASKQPEYCKNSTRSIKPDIFVALGVCTHLGCSPGVDKPNDGFLCACHGSNFDYAGRVLKGSPAPSNLEIPEHYYADDNTLVIGISASA